MNGKSGKSYDRKICHYGNPCEDDSCYVPKAVDTPPVGEFTSNDDQSLDVCFDIKVTGVSSSGGDYTKLSLYNADFDVGTPLLTDGTLTKTCKKATKNESFIIEYLSDDAVSSNFLFATTTATGSFR